jgi:hypothetical protein
MEGPGAEDDGFGLALDHCVSAQKQNAQPKPRVL